PPAQSQKLVEHKSGRSYTNAKHDLLEKNLRHLEDAAEMYDMLSRSRPWATIQCFDAQNNCVRLPEEIAAETFLAVKPLLTNHSKGCNMGFSEFLGNEKIVAALRGAFRSGRVPHALLFTGPRGVGKYTLARMFAQASNC